MKKILNDFFEILTTLAWIASTAVSIVCIGALVVGNYNATSILFIALPVSVISTILMIHYKWIYHVWGLFIPNL